jgi:hypothetical protein
VVQEIEGEHRELVLSLRSHGSAQAGEIRSAVTGGQDELAIDHCEPAANARQRFPRRVRRFVHSSQKRARKERGSCHRSCHRTGNDRLVRTEMTARR